MSKLSRRAVLSPGGRAPASKVEVAMPEPEWIAFYSGVDDGRGKHYTKATLVRHGELTWAGIRYITRPGLLRRFEPVEVNLGEACDGQERHEASDRHDQSSRCSPRSR